MMIKSGFRNFVDTASEIRPEVDGSFAQSMIPFGVQYLDRALSGIFPNDLIIVGAATGAGKSELATTIAIHNAELGNRVAFFALEAHHGEIELRTKFKLYARQMRERNMLPPSFGYEDFILGRYTAELQPFVINPTNKTISPDTKTINRSTLARTNFLTRNCQSNRGKLVMFTKLCQQ